MAMHLLSYVAKKFSKLSCMSFRIINLSLYSNFSLNAANWLVIFVSTTVGKKTGLVFFILASFKRVFDNS